MTPIRDMTPISVVAVCRTCPKRSGCRIYLPLDTPERMSKNERAELMSELNKKCARPHFEPKWKIYRDYGQ